MTRYKLITRHYKIGLLEIHRLEGQAGIDISSRPIINVSVLCPLLKMYLVFSGARFCRDLAASGIFGGCFVRRNGNRKVGLVILEAVYLL